MELPKNSTRYIKRQRDDAYDRYARKRYGKTKREERNKIIENDNKRYHTIVTMIIKELDKRSISIEDADFNKKIDEIIEMMLEHKSFKTIANDQNVVVKVRNALKRNLNCKRYEEGLSIGE